MEGIMEGLKFYSNLSGWEEKGRREGGMNTRERELRGNFRGKVFHYTNKNRQSVRVMKQKAPI